MATIIEKGTSATSPNDLLEKLKTFLETNGWKINKYDYEIKTETVTSSTKVLHVRHPNDANLNINFKTFLNEDTITSKDFNQTSPSNYGIGVYCSTGFDAAKAWDYQPGYPGVNSIVTCNAEAAVVIDPKTGLPVPPKSCYCGIPLSGTSIGNYYFLLSTSPAYLYVFVEPVAGKGIYEYIHVGNLVKVGSWTGGYFVSASRGKYNLFTWTGDMDRLDQYELQNYRPYSEVDYSNLFVYGNIDATTGWMSNTKTQGAEINCGTGRKCSGIVDPGVANVPSYKFLLGSGSRKTIPYTGAFLVEPDETGVLCNEFNSTSVLLPLYVYAVRDPGTWGKVSVIGYPPNMYMCNIKYLAVGGSYELDHTGQHFMTFPMSKKGGMYGYDGIAVKID